MIEEERHHPILDRPWTYRVESFSFRVGAEDSVDGELDIALEKDGKRVALRFLGVRSLEIDDGWPWTNSGMQILDESYRGMQDARIRVKSFEQDPAIRFWAADVKRIETGEARTGWRKTSP